MDVELRLAALAADDDEPGVTKLSARLDQGIGVVELSEVILAVEASVR